MPWSFVLALAAVALAVGVRADAPAAAPPAETARVAPAPFAFTARPLPPSVRRRMTGVSWRPGCPVGRGRLRYLRVRHVDFAGRPRTGELVVHRGAVPALRAVFARLYAERFPIRRMRLVDDYGGSDFDSIEADNTSAFNCRRATGSGRWSEHAYGRAIDVNPIENPYVFADGTTSHPRSRPYLDRSRRRPGMATPRSALVAAFADAGWGWGGTWSPAQDHQHFSASGR